MIIIKYLKNKRGIFVNAIKRYRLALGITQAQLAQRMKIGQSAVAMWESGENTPRTDKLPELAKIFNCDISDLFKK